MFDVSQIYLDKWYILKNQRKTNTMKRWSIPPIHLIFLFLSLFLCQETFSQDSDNDTVPDVTDIDDDNDGILDEDEILGCTGSLTYAFYDLSPTGNTVDNIPTTGELATGTVTDFDIDALQALVDPGDTDTFSIRYTGSIIIATDDTYTFYTTSDDGSKLYVNGVEVVDNDGAHASQERSGSIFLAAGNYSFTVEFFERNGQENLSVAYESSTIAKSDIAFSILALATICDFDGDGLTNDLDLDSDNDGIPDNVEAQSTFGYIPPSLVDSDGNGLDDAYESVPGAGEGIAPINTSSGSGFDFNNLDSDGDGLLDEAEAGLTLTGTDSDGDGLDNAVDTTNGTLPGGLPNYDDANGTINTPSSLPNVQNPLVAEVDYRDASLDSDMDNVIDSVDVDDDNDGILDVDETDCNGEISYEFYDLSPTGNSVDNIPTTGALGTGTFTSFDVDALQALVDPGDSDRYSIRYTGSIFIATADTYTFFTSSDDGSKLYIDGIEVVNNDGAHGVRERNGNITLNSGFHTIRVEFFERTGGDFLSVSYQSSTITKTLLPFSILFPDGNECDTDGDGTVNRLDTDSDNDNCNDANEAYDSLTADADGDGIYGTGTPTINPDGSVAGAPYTTPVDTNTNGAFDFLEAGSGAPSITTQPSDISSCLGCSVAFSVVGSADAFQWQRFDGSNWNDVSNTSPFSGANTATLTVNPLDNSLNGARFRVILTNSGVICPVLSDEAILSVSGGTVITNRRITYRVNRN